jgi:hypothetical protein
MYYDVEYRITFYYMTEMNRVMFCRPDQTVSVCERFHRDEVEFYVVEKGTCNSVAGKLTSRL